MTTTGTYAFDPSIADLTLNAFGRIGIRRSELTQQHMADAAVESNLVQVELSNMLPNLWLSELYTVTLSQGLGEYTLPSRLISPMAVYLTIENSGVSTDRILTPISTYEFSALPNKTIQAQPTTYWIERKISPIVHMWPVPDGNATYTLKMRIISQPQDTQLSNGKTLDFPYRWLDVFTAKLAHRLSRIYAPQLEDKRAADAEKAWEIAAKEDIEYTPLFIYPTLSHYYVR